MDLSRFESTHLNEVSNSSTNVSIRPKPSKNLTARVSRPSGAFAQEEARGGSPLKMSSQVLLASLKVEGGCDSYSLSNVPRRGRGARGSPEARKARKAREGGADDCLATDNGRSSVVGVAIHSAGGAALLSSQAPRARRTTRGRNRCPRSPGPASRLPSELP